MKKIYLFLFSLFLTLQCVAQSTVSTTIYYTGFQACGGCTVCGMDYWCFNTLGSYCGNTAPCGTQTFFDPVPPGNIVTNIQVQFYSAECSGGSLTATINGNTVPSVNEGATGCWCSNNPCAVSASSSGNYPCGMPNYVYGGNNSLQLCTGADVCINQIVLVITYYLPSAINPSITAMGPTNFCQGGSVVLDAGAGYAAYSWNTGANTQTINVNTSGTYIVTVTSLSGCTTGSASINVTVNANPTPVITANGPVNFCAGGSVVLDAGAGYSSYSWSTGPNSQTITVSASGTYNVTVTDANGCTGTASINVNTFNTPSVSASATQAGCGVANGSATANPSGGTAPYTYLWSNGDPNQTANNLPGGIYNVIVTDANGCTAQTSVTVPSTNAPTVSATSTQAGCSAANGTATANPSGGTPAYTYLWSDGQITQTAVGLAPGTYTVTVTDANGCSAVTTITVTGTAAPTTSTSVVSNVSCNGGNNGSATTTPSGGNPAYTYSWLPSGGNAQTANGLTAGTYTVTVTDANGCSVVDIITVSEPTLLTTTSSQTNILCNGASTGNATVTPSGGTPNYTYAWSPSGGNAATANNLSAGTYTCTVTDMNGCITTQTVTITQPTLLAAATSQINILCNGGNNGSATATPSGGTPGYNYSWNTVPVQNTQTANNLGPGTYVVTITDANGCTTQSSVTISEPPAITLAVAGNDSICSGDSTMLTATPGGGTPSYTFVWVPGPQSGTSINVSPSANTSYTVSMTDANGCVSTAQTFNISVLPAPTALFDTASNGMFGSVFSFNDLSTGGSTSWFWDFGDGTNSTLQNPVHTFPGSGTYTVTQVVFNQFGCPDTFRIIVDFSDGILIPNVFTPDGDGQNDVFFIPNSGMEEFHIELFDRWGAKVFETTADEIRWDGRSTSGKLLTDGTYFFSLRAILKSGAGIKNYSTNGYVSLLTKKK